MAEKAPSLSVVLIEPPTFPKGVLSLGLPAVAAALGPAIETHILDLNLFREKELKNHRELLQNALFIGLKVSSQNLSQSISITHFARRFSNVPIIWGGELPTLLPAEASKYCDSLVMGSFEPVRDELINDLQAGKLQQRYDGRGHYDLRTISPPDVRLHPGYAQYSSCMGVPVETSRGCDKKCTFCMVHTMQSKSDCKTEETLATELAQYPGRFINVVDYNLGVDREHTLRIASLLEQSPAVGWMGEMCLESLDDDQLLRALRESRCKMIYCGLESIDQLSLRSVNKARTNQLQNYERIIRKAQSYGVQIAAGIILGLEGSTIDSYRRTLIQFEEWGIAYAKLTFLTYNPGTKVKQSMQKKGFFLTEDIEQYDGNHLTFLPHGVNREETYAGAELFINEFYSRDSIRKRAKNAGLKGSEKEEFEFFNLYYRQVYLDWIKHGIFTDEAEFRKILEKPYKKSERMRILEEKIQECRDLNYALDKA